MTRKRLNQIIRDLKNFQKENAMDLITLENEEVLPRWEYEQLKSYRRQATNVIKQRTPEITEEVQPYESSNVTQARSNIKYMKGLETAEKDAFKLRKENILRTGNADYKMKKAITYRENYLNNFKFAFLMFEGFELLQEKLESIKNPIQFFEYIQQEAALEDMFLFYDKEQRTCIFWRNDTR